MKGGAQRRCLTELLTHLQRRTLCSGSGGGRRIKPPLSQRVRFVDQLRIVARGGNGGSGSSALFGRTGVNLPLPFVTNDATAHTLHAASASASAPARCCHAVYDQHSSAPTHFPTCPTAQAITHVPPVAMAALAAE